MEDIVEKAVRKGMERIVVEQVVNDIDVVLSVRRGIHPFPSESYIEEMKERYISSIFKSGRFYSEKLDIYKGILNEMSENKKLPDFNVDKLRSFRGDLSKYCDKHLDW